MKSLHLTQPHAIVMVGIPGSGKSFFAEKFADTFGAPYISFDVIRDITETSNSVVTKLFMREFTEIAKTKSSIVIEGMSHSRIERTNLAKLLRYHGYEPLFVWVQIDTASAKTRSLKTKPHRTQEQHIALAKKFSPPHSNEKPLVISGKHTYASQVKVVLKRLSAPRADISTHTVTPTRSLADVRRNKS